MSAAESMERASEGDALSGVTMVRCSVHKGTWRCKNTFVPEMALVRGKLQPLKTCLHHRLKQRAKNKTPVGKACHKRALVSEAGRASYKKMLKSDSFKKRRRKYKKTPNGKECARRYRQSPAGKAHSKRNSKRMHTKRMANPAKRMEMYLRNRFNDMVRNGFNSKRVKAFTDFESADEFKEHIESTFVDGMSWDNHGHRSDALWNIGHRISVKMYDAGNDDDLKRCWSMKNMFAQWSIENQTLGVALPSDAELLDLRTIWPTAWGDALPSQERRKELEVRARNAFGMAKHD